MPRALAVLFNGPPGAGKTTLGRAVARHLGLPLLSKDIIKEARADVLGTSRDGWPQRRWNRAIGAAASETIWALLADSPAGGVLDSCWPVSYRDFAVAGLARAGSPATAEVWCEIPVETARRRFEARPPRHPIHGDPMSDEEWDLWKREGRPLGIGPLLRVDTTRPVDVAAVAAWARDQAELPGAVAAGAAPADGETMWSRRTAQG